MSLTINTNLSAMAAHTSLSNTDSALSKSIQRLSSGYKINSAGDDPAGLVISQKLAAQVSGLGQAIKNAGDAVNMVKTAEGALSQVNTLLNSMRDLAVHAANAGANDQASITADQAQITNALASINKISTETQFGSKQLLDGSAGIKAQVIGNAGAAQATGGKFDSATTLQDGDVIHIATTQAASQGHITTVDMAGNGDDTTKLAGAEHMTINGKAYTFGTNDNATTIAAAINADSATTGAQASLNGDGTVKISSVAYGSGTTLTLTSVDAGVLANNVTSAAATGQDVKATVTYTHPDTTTGNVSDATWQSGKGSVLKDSLGNEIDLTDAAASGATGTLTTTMKITKGSLVFQVGAYAGQTREMSISSVGTDYLGLGAVNAKKLSDLDVTTTQGAQDALKILDKAISDVSTTRANLGAMQTNVFESSISSLTVAQQNIQASESSITDTDMASEMTNFTHNQVLEQAGVSMLAQANQMPQMLLKLLQ